MLCVRRHDLVPDDFHQDQPLSPLNSLPSFSPPCSPRYPPTYSLSARTRPLRTAPGSVRAPAHVTLCVRPLLLAHRFQERSVLGRVSALHCFLRLNNYSSISREHILSSCSSADGACSYPVRSCREYSPRTFWLNPVILSGGPCGPWGHLPVSGVEC